MPACARHTLTRRRLYVTQSSIPVRPPRRFQDKKMKRSLTVGALMTLLFLLTRSLFSALPGAWSEPVGGLAAALVSLLLVRGATMAGLPRQTYYRPFSPSPVWFAFTPFFILTILGLSTLTGLVGAAVGWEESASYSGPLAWLLLVHAVIPALCEEVTFRFCLPSLLAPYGKAGSVICCSVLFALMHTSPLRIPYALAAGLFLGTLAEACRSPLPGMVMHLLNNACSLLISLYGMPALAAVLSVLGVAAVVCGILLYKKRRELRADIAAVWAKDAGTARMAAQLIVSPMVVPVLFLVWLTVRGVMGN